MSVGELLAPVLQQLAFDLEIVVAHLHVHLVFLYVRLGGLVVDVCQLATFVWVVVAWLELDCWVFWLALPPSG